MKILIIAIPRSGSTTLMNSIGNSLKLKRIVEPFNESDNKDVNWDYTPENNVIVKDLIAINVNNPIEFYKNYSKLFDKTILLSRKSTQELVESCSFQALQPNQLPNRWHEKYIYTQKGDISGWKNWMIKTKNNLETLSNELNIEIDWYEDLYCGDEEKIVNFLNKHKINVDIPEFTEYLNPKHRLRQFKKTII
tara:strand:+ start:69 stop:647 length:579 start_codon:yes stop_codon:yes gene_type:complete